MSGGPGAERIAGRYRVIEAGALEERGVDDESGAAVLVRPAATGGVTGVKFLEQEELERRARVAMSLDTPWLLPVLCPAPRVVYAVPPPAARPEAPLAPPDAAECLLQLCDVLSRAHAAGEAGFGADVHDVRVHREAGAWRITVVLPHLPPRGRWSHADLAPWDLSPVRRDVWTAVSFFRDLLLGGIPTVNIRVGRRDPPLPPFGDDAVHAALSRVLSGGQRPAEGGSAARDSGPRDMASLEGSAARDTGPRDTASPEGPAVWDTGPADIASLAELVLPLCRAPADWHPRVAAMPRVAAVRAARDWDRLIVLGEEERAAGRHPDNPYVCYPLAAAYHQRACAAYARGDHESALRDVEQAVSIDRWPRYLVTRGVVRAALGDPEGACSDYDAAVGLARAPAPPESEAACDPDLVSPWEWPGAEPVEGARAYYARGVARCRKGNVAGAREDLEEALQALLVASHGGYFAASSPELSGLETTVRRALVPIYRALLRAAPSEPQWRWSLARVLLALGREEEARAEADRILAQSPGDARVRRRHARMFGGQGPSRTG